MPTATLYPTAGTASSGVGNTVTFVADGTSASNLTITMTRGGTFDSPGSGTLSNFALGAIQQSSITQIVERVSATYTVNSGQSTFPLFTLTFSATPGIGDGDFPAVTSSFTQTVSKTYTGSIPGFNFTTTQLFGKLDDTIGAGHDDNATIILVPSLIVTYTGSPLVLWTWTEEA